MAVLSRQWVVLIPISRVIILPATLATQPRCRFHYEHHFSARPPPQKKREKRHVMTNANGLNNPSARVEAAAALAITVAQKHLPASLSARSATVFLDEALQRCSAGQWLARRVRIGPSPLP